MKGGTRIENARQRETPTARVEAGRERRARTNGDRGEAATNAPSRGQRTGKAGATPRQEPEPERTPARSTPRKPTAARDAAARQPSRWRAVAASGRPFALLLALLLGGALAYLLSAGMFAVRQVEVLGATATSPQGIATASGVLGYNIFTVDPQQVADRLVALPTVGEAEVWTELPDRLVVRVVERRGALIWQVGEGRFLVDERGFVIAADPHEEQSRGLPTLQARDTPPPDIGARVDPDAVRAALAVARPPAGNPLLPFTTLEWSPRSGLLLAGDGGWQIILGGQDRLPEKLAASAELLRGDRPWRIADLTDPDRPVYK